MLVNVGCFMLYLLLLICQFNIMSMTRNMGTPESVEGNTYRGAKILVNGQSYPQSLPQGETLFGDDHFFLPLEASFLRRFSE